MAIPYINGLTGPELEELFQKVVALRGNRRSSAAANLNGARRALDELIGPDNPTEPSMSSLTEVQLYTDAQIRDNAALAIRLSFRATEQLARIVRDILTLVQ